MRNFSNDHEALSINTATVRKQAPLGEIIEACARLDIRMICPWRDQVQAVGLEEIATLTAGAYYRAEDRRALTSIYEQIDQLERTEISTHTYMEYFERFPAFVLPAVALLLCEVLLLGTRFRKLP